MKFFLIVLILPLMIIVEQICVEKYSQVTKTVETYFGMIDALSVACLFIVLGNVVQ